MATISVPPLEAPILKSMAEAIPGIIIANISSSKGSSVSGLLI